MMRWAWSGTSSNSLWCSSNDWYYNDHSNHTITPPTSTSQDCKPRAGMVYTFMLLAPKSDPTDSICLSRNQTITILVMFHGDFCFLFLADRSRTQLNLFCIRSEWYPMLLDPIPMTYCSTGKWLPDKIIACISRSTDIPNKANNVYDYVYIKGYMPVSAEPLLFLPSALSARKRGGKDVSVHLDRMSKKLRSRMDDAKGQWKLWISLISVTPESQSGVFFCIIGITHTNTYSMLLSTNHKPLPHQEIFLQINIFRFSYSRVETCTDYKNSSTPCAINMHSILLCTHEPIKYEFL